MDDLKARLRRVRVTLDKDVRIRGDLPSEWLDVSVEGNVVTFVDARFSDGQFGSRIAAILGQTVHIETQPIPLRSIFTALARAMQERKL